MIRSDETRMTFLHHRRLHRGRQLRWVLPLAGLLFVAAAATLLVQYQLSDEAVGTEFFRAHKTIAHTGTLLWQGMLAGLAVLALAVVATALFALRYTQGSGEFAFGAFPADNSRWLATSTTGYRDGDAREIAFTVDLKAGEAAVVRVANNNNYRNGKAASFRLLQFTATLADAR